MKKYCYKFKHAYLKLDSRNAYKRPRIEKELGFMPIMEDIETGGQYWAEGWARTIAIPHDSSVGKWLKKNVESIYKAEMKKVAKKGFDSKWLDSIKESGYEFDAEGNLVENEKSKEDVPAQLCVMYTGPFHGQLFVNIGDGIEFYESKAVSECAPDIIQNLLANGAIYEKRFNA